MVDKNLLLLQRLAVTQGSSWTNRAASLCLTYGFDEEEARQVGLLGIALDNAFSGFTVTDTVSRKLRDESGPVAQDQGGMGADSLHGL